MLGHRLLARQPAEPDVRVVLGKTCHLLGECQVGEGVRQRAGHPRAQSDEAVDDRRRGAATAIPEGAVRGRTLTSPGSALSGGNTL